MIAGRSISTALHLPAVRLKTRPGACTSCGTCERGCPMSLDIGAMARKGRPDHHDCILCAVCADSCPSGVISLGFHPPQQK